jgi:hypothetical protein
MLKDGKKLNVFYILSIPIIILTAIGAFGGIFFEGLYRDPHEVLVQALAQDVVTLFIILPVFVISLFFSQKGSLKGTIVWLGCLGYTLYTYILYTAMAAFNVFFLIYVAIYSLSLFTFIGALLYLNPVEIKTQFKEGIPKRIISAILIVIGAFMLLTWFKDIFDYTFIQKNLSAPDVGQKFVYGIDMGFFLPLMILSGFLLWKNHRFGYLFSGIVLIKGITVGIAVVAMAILEFLQGYPSGLELLPIFSVILVFFIIAIILYFKNIEKTI